MKMFWQHQSEAVSKKQVHKYHPMIIRFCLSLYAKSPSTYNELQDSNILTLPSKRALLDNKILLNPKLDLTQMSSLN